MKYDYDRIVELFKIDNPVSQHILKLFLENPSKEFVRKEICRITGEAPTTVWDNLQRLVKVDLLGSEKKMVNRIGTTSRIFFVNDKLLEVVAEEHG